MASEMLRKAMLASRIFEDVLVTREGDRLVERPRAPDPAMLHKGILPAVVSSEFDEYKELCQELGVDSPSTEVECLKQFLVKKNWPVYDLATVVAYMNEKFAAEGIKPRHDWSTDRIVGGWGWKPLRQADRMTSTAFGTQAWRTTNAGQFTPSSDWYESDAPVYRLQVPKHALQKALELHREFGNRVALLVSDYLPAPQFKADPFLMVCVRSAIQGRDGDSRGARFVIDFWDEPGFGLTQQLKPGI